MRTIVPKLLVCLGIGLAGCSTPKEYKDMTEVEKAAQITKLRKQAEGCIQAFIASEGSPEGLDLDALKCYVDLQRETTKVAPATCPLCYYNYAVGLSRLGFYYRDAVAQFELLAGKAGSAAEKQEALAKVAKYREEMRASMLLSNRQFEIYFNSGEAVDPRAYSWVYRQCQELGDYTNARRYLDLYLGNVALTPEAEKEVTAIRRELDEQARRQAEDELRREMEAEEKSGTTRRPSQRLPEMAN